MLLGVAATSIDRAARIVRLSTGEELGYDRLVLATGSRANVPTLDGVERHRRDLASLEKYARHLVAHDDELPEGITALRDLADADRVLEAVRERRRIIVLGAGVLGLELALAAAHAGAQVCVVHHGPHPMPRNLDRGGGQVLRAALRRTGITVIAHSRAEAVAYRTDADGRRRFDMLVTADGKQLRGDLLVLSCGVSPRNELATLAGLRTAVGIVVHPDLRSWSDPDVYAIGDCAQVVERTDELAGQRVLPGAPSGLIGPGWRQAAWLAAAFAAEAEGASTDAAVPEERDPIVMLKAEHIDVVAVGEIAADPWDDDALHPRRRVSQWADPEHLRYVKMVTEDGVLTRLRQRRDASHGRRAHAALRAARRAARRSLAPAPVRRTRLRPERRRRRVRPVDDGLLVQRGDRRSHRGVGRVRQHDRRVRRTGHARRHRLRRMQGPDRGRARPRGGGRRDAEPHALTVPSVRLRRAPSRSRRPRRSARAPVRRAPCGADSPGSRSGSAMRSPPAPAAES